MARGDREQLGECARDIAPSAGEAQFTVAGQRDVQRDGAEHSVGSAHCQIVQLVAGHGVAQRRSQLVRNAQLCCRGASCAIDQPLAGEPPAQRGGRRQRIATDDLNPAAAKAAQVQGIEELLHQAQIGRSVHDTIVR